MATEFFKFSATAQLTTDMGFVMRPFFKSILSTLNTLSLQYQLF
jgi:hypothetical protein